jgi:hypothetical protein
MITFINSTIFSLDIHARKWLLCPPVDHPVYLFRHVINHMDKGKLDHQGQPSISITMTGLISLTDTKRWRRYIFKEPIAYSGFHNPWVSRTLQQSITTKPPKGVT